jgi:hypothetical protein
VRGGPTGSAQSSNAEHLVGLGGLEPPTSPLSGARSSHLSYRPNLVEGNTLSLIPNSMQIGLRDRLATGEDQKSANTSEIQPPNSRYFIIRQRMCIARSHRDFRVPQKLLHRDQVHS